MFIKPALYAMFHSAFNALPESSRSIKITLVISILVLCMSVESYSQGDKIPYQQIPEAPESYDSGNVIGRMIDGLGFRYYWATEGLTNTDINYKPSAEARTLMETLDHVYGLSTTIVNTARKKANVRPAEWPEMGLAEKRSQTLRNFEQASELFKNAQTSDLENYQVIFQRGDNRSEFPFWNLINGPIADAIWHTGQVVLMRRASGNPMNPKVNVFMGKGPND